MTPSAHLHPYAAYASSLSPVPTNPPSSSKSPLVVVGSVNAALVVRLRCSQPLRLLLQLLVVLLECGQGAVSEESEGEGRGPAGRGPAGRGPAGRGPAGRGEYAPESQ